MEAPYVIVGGGIAGVSCVEALSILDDNASVIMVSASPTVKAVTSVKPLTKMLTEFEIEEKTNDYASAKYPGLKIINEVAVRINAKHKTLFTSSGLAIKYQKLCLCSGASPKVIYPQSKYIIGIRDTDSAELLQNKLKDAKRIVVIGNGGIATELIYEIEGVDIVWAVKDKHISSAFVDAGAAEFFQSRLKKSESPTPVIKTMKYTVEEKNLKNTSMGAALGPNWHDKIELKSLRTNSSSNVIIEYEVEVESLIEKQTDDPDKWPVYVKLTNGKEYGCDFVISATGVIPNSRTIIVDDDDWKIAPDEGLCVNWRMETNIPDVYAAGDVCTASWTLAKHWFQMRLWTQARQMGMYAARCMVDSLNGINPVQDFCFELFAHVTRFFGYKVILLGLFNGQKLEKIYELLLRVTNGLEYVKLVVSQGKLQGAILIGETDLEEMCENLILNQLDISQLGEDLLNPNIDIEDYFD